MSEEMLEPPDIAAKLVRREEKEFPVRTEKKVCPESKDLKVRPDLSEISELQGRTGDPDHPDLRVTEEAKELQAILDRMGFRV